ncbi:MAG: PhoX family protein [Halocynthiibacter sp.]
MSHDSTEISFDDFDEMNNPHPEICEFDEIVETALSRRGFLGGVMTFGVGSFLLGTSGIVSPAKADGQMTFPFEAIPTSTEDTVVVPEGYEWNMMVNWGDPLFSDVPEFDEATRGTAATQARAFGDNNDGMAFFERGGKRVMAVNNEYTNRKIMWGNHEDGKAASDDDVEKGMMAHGVSVFEVEVKDGHWGVKKDADVNRRITPQTEMVITGPASGHDLLKTKADPTGTKTRGTWNNCGNGRTPWGTYLTCEENFNGYFSAADESFEVSADKKRYGIGVKDWGYGWAKIDDRFDISKEPNEANRAGYIVEIDPFDPTSTPKKHTALGRFKHENAEAVIAKDGRVVVYLGDDERGEFLYRYVSKDAYVEGGDTSTLLTEGTLYVAKFDDKLRGKWLALTPETTGMSEAEISISTRIAASNVGATTMDRPEWVASNPNKVENYVALTNNKNRGLKPNKGGDDTPVGGPNPREKNVYGQILRWVPDEENHTADGFAWTLFALAGNPEIHDDLNAGSENINAGNMFNSPDGMAFDSTGLLWIQTDGKYSNKDDFAGMGNNQMLAGDTETGEIRRFMVGPRECEITGICWSDDRKTAFVGIQHPGEKGDSHFPAGGTSVPRSGIVAIRRKDGATIG